MKFLPEILFLAAIFGICDYHDHLFKENKQVSPLFHALWAAAYFVPAVYVSLYMFDDWILLAALTAERFVFYNVILNKMRGMPFFYLSVNSRNPSLWDHLEIAWAGAYPYVWGISLAGFISLQFFL